MSVCVPWTRAVSTPSQRHSKAQMNWAMAGTNRCAALMIPFWGELSDRLGRRWVLTLGPHRQCRAGDPDAAAQGNIWLATLAVLLAARYPCGHGAAVPIGNPRTLGITDLHPPDLSLVPPMASNELPARWAYAGTPQQVLPQLRSAYCTPALSKKRLLLNHRPEAFGWFTVHRRKHRKVRQQWCDAAVRRQ